MMWWLEGWVWVVAGIALAGLEVVVPGYVFLGFAAGAIGVGLLIWTGVVAAGLPVLLLIFAVVSLAAWWALRRIFGMRKGSVKIWEQDIND